MALQLVSQFVVMMKNFKLHSHDGGKIKNISYA